MDKPRYAKVRTFSLTTLNAFVILALCFRRSLKLSVALDHRDSVRRLDIVLHTSIQSRPMFRVLVILGACRVPR